MPKGPILVDIPDQIYYYNASKYQCTDNPEECSKYYIGNTVVYSGNTQLLVGQYCTSVRTPNIVYQIESENFNDVLSDSVDQFFFDCNEACRAAIPPSPFPTPSPTATPSITPSPSKTPSVTPSPSKTPSVTPSVTPSKTPNFSPSVTPSLTVTPSVTPSVTVTPSITVSVTPSPTPAPTERFILNIEYEIASNMSHSFLPNYSAPVVNYSSPYGAAEIFFDYNGGPFNGQYPLLPTSYVDNLNPVTSSYAFNMSGYRSSAQLAHYILDLFPSIGSFYHTSLKVYKNGTKIDEFIGGSGCLIGIGGDLPYLRFIGNSDLGAVSSNDTIKVKYRKTRNQNFVSKLKYKDYNIIPGPTDVAFPLYVFYKQKYGQNRSIEYYNNILPNYMNQMWYTDASASNFFYTDGTYQIASHFFFEGLDSMEIWFADPNSGGNVNFGVGDGSGDYTSYCGPNNPYIINNLSALPNPGAALFSGVTFNINMSGGTFVYC